MKKTSIPRSGRGKQMKKTSIPRSGRGKQLIKTFHPSQWSNFFQEWNEKNRHRVARGSLLTLAKRMERKKSDAQQGFTSCSWRNE